MTDLRARLAEVLALYEGDELEYVESLLNGMNFLRDPALARALEDAERVPALEAECARLRESRDAYKHDAGALLKILQSIGLMKSIEIDATIAANTIPPGLRSEG